METAAVQWTDHMPRWVVGSRCVMRRNRRTARAMDVLCTNLLEVPGPPDSCARRTTCGGGHGRRQGRARSCSSRHLAHGRPGVTGMPSNCVARSITLPILLSGKRIRSSGGVGGGMPQWAKTVSFCSRPPSPRQSEVASIAKPHTVPSRLPAAASCPSCDATNLAGMGAGLDARHSLIGA